MCGVAVHGKEVIHYVVLDVKDSKESKLETAESTQWLC